MRKLDLDERHALIDMLCRIPNIASPSERFSLLATLPEDLRSNIAYNEAYKPHITNIIDMVLDSNWLQLSDGSYPLVVIIQSARYKVGHSSKIGIELQKVLDSLNETLLPVSTQQNPVEHDAFTNHTFKQKLSDLSHAVKELMREIQSISASFSWRILQPECTAISKQLDEKSSFVEVYLAFLLESSKLPSDVISNRVWIINELTACNQYIHSVKASIDGFCTAHGTAVHQPVEKRQDIQRQLEKLSQCCNTTLKATEDMYASLAEKEHLNTDHTTTYQG